MHLKPFILLKIIENCFSISVVKHTTLLKFFAKHNNTKQLFFVVGSVQQNPFLDDALRRMNFYRCKLVFLIDIRFFFLFNSIILF
jgi:hypothetical protein